jgi:hypothetical protein
MISEPYPRMRHVPCPRWGAYLRLRDGLRLKPPVALYAAICFCVHSLPLGLRYSFLPLALRLFVLTQGIVWIGA